MEQTRKGTNGKKENWRLKILHESSNYLLIENVDSLLDAEQESALQTTLQVNASCSANSACLSPAFVVPGYLACYDHKAKTKTCTVCGSALRVGEWSAASKGQQWSAVLGQQWSAVLCPSTKGPKIHTDWPLKHENQYNFIGFRSKIKEDTSALCDIALLFVVSWWYWRVKNTYCIKVKSVAFWQHNQQCEFLSHLM